jgi:ribose transport system substrate-binding protein
MKKQSNLKLFAVLVILSLITMVGACGNTRTSDVPEKIRVAVITKTTTSKFFKIVYSGAKTAASEYNIEVTCDGPDNENDYEKQNELIEKAMEDEVGAIVISAIDKDNSIKLLEKAKQKGIHVIVIDSGINSDLVEARIETDNYDAGRKMALALIEEENFEGRKIGIVNFNSDSENVLGRESGFIDTIETNGSAEIIGKINVDSNVAKAKNGALDFIDTYPDIDTIVTFNEWTTLGVGYAIEERELQDEIKVIGFDNNVISVAMLESGEIDGLIVQNPYAMGYLGVEIAYQLIKGNTLEETDITTDIMYITRANLYDQASQEILFPLEGEE